MSEFRLIAYVVGFVASMALVWKLVTYFEDVGYQRAKNHYEALIADAAKASLVKERELQAKVDDANKRSAEREKQHRVEVSILESNARRLRNDISEFKRRLPTVSGSACIEAADTVADIYAECIGAYQSMAQAADGHANDARTCAEAWPK